MPDHGHHLGPLARKALDIRSRVFRHPAQVSFNASLWPGWWAKETALRAVAYLRDAGVHDDAVEAALLLVGCAHSDPETDDEITVLGGEVAMAVKVLQGRPSDYPRSYWRELSEAVPEHQLARAALQLALLDDAQDWPDTGNRRRKVFGDALHRVLPMLSQMHSPAARALARQLVVRLRIMRPAAPVE